LPGAGLYWHLLDKSREKRLGSVKNMGAQIILIPEEVQAVPGTPLRPAVDLSDPAERKRVTPTAIKTFRQITDQKWALSEAQSLGLLDGVA
jgi:hypothetical protein